MSCILPLITQNLSIPGKLLNCDTRMCFAINLVYVASCNTCLAAVFALMDIFLLIITSHLNSQFKIICKCLNDITENKIQEPDRKIILHQLISIHCTTLELVR